MSRPSFDSDDLPPPSEDDFPPPPEDDDDFPPPGDDEFDEDMLPPDDGEDFNDDDFPPDDMSMPPDDDPSFGDDMPPPSEDGFSEPPPDDDSFGPPESEGPPPSDFDDDFSLPPPSEMSFDEPSPPPKGGKNSNFVLPVHPPKASSTGNGSLASGLDSLASSNINLDMLSAGLQIKEPPKLIRKSVRINETTHHAPPPPPLPIEEGDEDDGNSRDDEEQSEQPSSTQASTAKSAASGATEVTKEHLEDVKRIALEQGYMFALGKYEGDPYEPLYVKVDKTAKTLTVIIESGEQVTFLLGHKAYIFEDTADSNTIVLDYRKQVVVFKFGSADMLINFMKHMPEDVFMAPDSTQEDAEAEAQAQKEADELRKKQDKKKPTKLASKPRQPGEGPKIEHVKGQSVEDILENDFESEDDRQEKLDAMFAVKDTTVAPPPIPPHPQRRKELIDTYIRKPKYSVRRVTLICEWINSLHIWPNTISITTLHKEMCNGLLLARIVKHLNPEVSFVHLNEKPLAKKSAVENLEQAIGHIWRSKSLNNSRIPSALEIYAGNTSKTAILLNEIYGVYVLKPLYKNTMKMLKWYHYVLRQYARPIPNYVFDDGDLSGVWPHFQSGTALFCVLYHFFGQGMLGSGDAAQRVDPLRLVGDPTSICDFRDNIQYVFHLLSLLNIDILWTAEDWISNPDTEFILLQLQYIYDVLKFRQCTLPPAQGDKPGLTSGPGGEALVVGLVFSDAPINLRFIPKSRKAVRLGYDKDSMPLLPVDRSSTTNSQSHNKQRYVLHGILPLGMLSNPHVKISRANVELKEIAKIHTDRNNWNTRTTVTTEKENYEGSHLVTLLRDHHTATTTTKAQQMQLTNNLHDIATGRTAVTTHKTTVDAQGNVVSGQHTHHHTTFSAPLLSSMKTQEDVGKEIQGMISQLEDEMTSAQEKMNTFEDMLANKYMELEARSTSMNAADYETQFEALEDERINLEAERVRLQEYFARKLALIRERKEEIHTQHYQKQQQAFASFAQELQQQQQKHTTTATPSSPMHHSSTASQQQRTKNSGTVTKTLPKRDAQSAEKGWIKLSAKMDTHNFHLKNKQAVAVAAFQTKITPKQLLAREQLEKKTTFSPTKAGAAAGYANMQQTVSSSSAAKTNVFDASDVVSAYYTAPPNLSPEEAVADSFKRFKLRLFTASQKWHQSKFHPTAKPSLLETINSVAKPVDKHIAVPEKLSSSLNSHELHLPQGDMALRNEELQIMYYEDERRRMVLAEANYEKSIELSQQLFNNSAIMQPAHGQQQQHEDSYGADQSMTQGHNASYFSPLMMYDNTSLHASPHRPSNTPSADMYRLNKYSAQPPTMQEIDAAIRFLTTPRPLVINDRSPKEFVFSLLDVNHAAQSSSNESKRNQPSNSSPRYAIEWKEINPFNGEEYIAGIVLLEDVSDVELSEQDAQQCQLFLSESTRALKNAKGRTAVSLKFTAAKDSVRYAQAVCCLMAIA